MLKYSWIYFLTLPLSAAAIIALSAPDEKPYREKVLDYINTHKLTEETKIIDPEKSSEISTGALAFQNTAQSFGYKNGDWQKYINYPEYGKLSEEQKKTILIDSDEDFQLLSYGNMKLNLKYGGSVFTDEKYKQYDTDAPVSRLIQPGFLPEQQMQVHMEGKIGKRLTVFIDHDSTKKDNKYVIQYKAIRDDELIREINAGDIDIKFNHSKYAVYDNTTSKGMGIDVTLKKNNLQIKAFGSISKGQTEIEYFRGNSSPGSNKLAEYNYIKKMFYQLEPFKRYDARTTPPILDPEFNTSVTITSNPSSPDTYSLTQVNIDPNSFELYMDPQNQYANLNSIQLSKVDTQGHYTKLMQGAEYSINFTTGVITFIRDIPSNAKIFAVYTFGGGSTATTDASAYPPLDIDHPGGQFSGKIFVFIKYGYSINEKTTTTNYSTKDPGMTVIQDNKVHLDVYEIRSFYQIGDRQLLTDNFSLKFYNENQSMDQTSQTKLGKYTIDYSKGLIQFTLREPFKTVLPSNFLQYIYAENQSTSAYQYSRYNIKIDYYKEARSFQLKHFNLLPNSVRVKVNDIEIAQGLYMVDHVSGFLMFLDPNNPVIGPETKIEIKYEYMPFLSQSQSFIGGVRVDYKVLDAINFGGSILYSNSSGITSIPMIGNTPNQLFLFEGDVSLDLNERKMAGVVNAIAGTNYRTVPVEFKAYGEYARSYTTFNTFGKALIDNLETANEIISISTSEKEWQLASMPFAYTNLDRAMLNYYFYRDPLNPGTLFGPGYSAIPVDYRIKSGPYNVATGHVPFNITPEASQRSLVFDMNFSYEGGAETVVSVASRKLSTTAVDFSGLQYVEVSYMYQGSADISINFDLGKINEDSDSNGILGTEDLNRNGILDSDPSLNYYEDVGYDFYGYKFNSNATARVGSGPRLSTSTMGDGVLNSEDLNGNGVLDTIESVYTIPSSTISSSTQWKTIVIPVDFSNSESNKAIMKQVESLRLYIKKISGGNTGKLYIDNIKFVALKWSNIQKAAGDTLNVSIVNNISDVEYSANSFILSNPEVYKQLYGEKNAQDLVKQTESSLQLIYNIISNPIPIQTSVSVTQRFQNTMDLRFYNTLNLWLNIRPTSSPGDQIGIIIGSSDSDYIEYKFNMNNDGAWREIKMKLKNGSSGSVAGTVTGFPDMKRIIFIKAVVYNSAAGHSGKLWIDNIYASEPDVLEDGAHWVETELKITKPLFITKDGTPVFSDFAIKYTTKGYGANFNTIGKKDSDISELYHELTSSVKILPNWNTQFAMYIEDSSTDSLNEKVIDSKRGTRKYNSIFVASDYTSNINAVPTVKVSYKNDNYNQSVNERINSTLVNKIATSSIHTPLITIIEKIDNFLWGKLNAVLNMNMLFKEDTITRDTTFLPSNVSEKRQKSSAVLNLDYQNKIFYIQPNFSTASEEVVNGVSLLSLNNTEITGNVNGSFHFPFAYEGNDFRFVEKSMLTGFVIGINQSQYFSPSYKMDINYLENRFRDFNFTTSPEPDFKRVKDARSYMSTQIALPINLYKIPETKFIKNFSFNYLRSVYLYETDIPYEGEKTAQGNEQYGISRALSTIAGAALNIFQYWPGYFFTGRNNSAAGRDYITGTINNHTSGTQYTGYNNNLRLIDNFSFNFTLDFDKIAVVSSLSLNQVAERLNIFGISQQVITFRYGINFTFDFMKLFTSGEFFRPNQVGKPYHGLVFDIGYAISDNMLITTNIEELVHSPLIGFSIKWGRANVGIKTGVDYKERYFKEFIVDDGGPDSIYAKNIPGNSVFKNTDMGFKLSFIFETDVNWLYNFFASFYKLTASPIFTFEYIMGINRYDYSMSVSPQPYDSYLFNMKLTLDLHKNIQGGIQSRFALEQYRSWLTTGISREVFSYEIALNFTLLF